MTDEVLESPSEHTVEEVVAALDGQSSDVVAQVQDRERQGKGRKGILEYGRPAPDAEAEYDVAGWRERARVQLHVSPHVIAGALYGADPGATFTEADVRSRVDEFLGREVRT